MSTTDPTSTVPDQIGLPAETAPTRRTAASPRPGRLALPLRRPRATSRRRLRRVVAVDLARLVIEGVLDPTDANQQLADLGIPALRGPRDAHFRVPATIHTRAAGPWRAIANSLATIRAECHPMRFTRFTGCPEGYGIDNPIPPGLRYVTVHTDLRLTVTVAAFVEHQWWRTALALLETDLDRLHRVAVDPDRVTAWPHDPANGPTGQDDDPDGDDQVSLAYARRYDLVGHGHGFTRLHT